MVGPDPDELAYYRAVEDQFAALRGTPFLFSPRDFALLRRWYGEGVPLAAVLAGIGEAWEKRRARDADPISSLSYCRHAVTRHARRLHAARVGSSDREVEVDVAGALRSLAEALAAAAARWRGAPRVAGVLADLERAVTSLPADGEPGAVDGILAELEFAALEAAELALPPARREELAAQVEGEVAGLALAPDVRERTRRALLAKALRRLLELPRMEIGSGAR
jgi:hypothetical protein